MFKVIKNNVHIFLMYLGTLPFIIFMLSIIKNCEYNSIITNTATESIKLYGLIISVFMAGIQWGLGLEKLFRYKLFIFSNVITIILWISYQIHFQIQKQILSMVEKNQKNRTITSELQT